jgi:hypothetical protein
VDIDRSNAHITALSKFVLSVSYSTIFLLSVSNSVRFIACQNYEIAQDLAVYSVVVNMFQFILTVEIYQRTETLDYGACIFKGNVCVLYYYQQRMSNDPFWCISH